MHHEVRTCVLILTLLAGISPTRSIADDPPNAKVIHDRIKGAANDAREGVVLDRVMGKVSVVNANTLEYADGTLVTLDMLVPHPNQCALKGDLLYPCGLQAIRFLQELIDDRPVTCIRPVDARGPWNGYVEDISLEHKMVISGWAMTDRRTWEGAEVIARENGRGMWRGKFVPLDDWLSGVRLAGEPPPEKLVSEQEANALLEKYGHRPEACTTLVTRIVNDLPQIKKLAFPRESRLNDDGFAKLARLAELEELDLAYSVELSEDGLAPLAAMKGVKTLVAPQSISDQGVVHVTKMAQLSSLYLGPGSPVTDDGIAHISHMKSLRQLTLHDLQLTDAAIKHLARHNELLELLIFARRSTVTDAGIKSISELHQLRRLTLVSVQMTDAGLAHIAQLANLVALDFGGIHLTDAGLKHLAKLRNLEYLDVSDTQVTDEVVRQYAELPQLRVLLIPGHITAETRKHLRDRLPQLKFDGKPEDVLANR